MPVGLACNPELHGGVCKWKKTKLSAID